MTLFFEVLVAFLAMVAYTSWSMHSRLNEIDRLLDRIERHLTNIETTLDRVKQAKIA